MVLTAASRSPRCAGLDRLLCMGLFSVFCCPATSGQIRSSTFAPMIDAAVPSKADIHQGYSNVGFAPSGNARLIRSPCRPAQTAPAARWSSAVMLPSA